MHPIYKITTVTTTISTKRIYVVIYLHEDRYLPGSNIWNQLPVFVCLDSISKFLKIFLFLFTVIKYRVAVPFMEFMDLAFTPGER